MTNVAAFTPRPSFSIEYLNQRNSAYRPRLDGERLSDVSNIDLPVYFEGSILVRNQPIHGQCLPRHVSRHLAIENAEVDLSSLPVFVGGTLTLFRCTAPQGLILPQHVGGKVYLIDCDIPSEVVPGRFVGSHFVVAESNVRLLAHPEYIAGVVYTNMSAAAAAEEATKEYLGH